MKKMTQILTPGLMAVALLFAPALVNQVAAQDPAATPAAAPTQEDKDCGDLYDKFVASWTQKPVGSGQAAAYPIGKQYMEKCGARDNEYTKYVKDKVTKYEAATLRNNFEIAAAKGTADAAPDVYKYGKQLLAAKADDLEVIVALGHYGDLATQAKNTTFQSDGINYTKQAIQLLEASDPPATVKLTPFANKGEALGWLYFDLGAVLKDSAPAEAIGYLYKASQTQVKIPKGRDLFYLAEAYNIDVEVAHKAFLVFNGQPVSSESKAAGDHWYQLMDRAIDFYGRAIAAARADTSDPANKTFADEGLEQLTIYYKIRHPDATDAAINAYIAGVNGTPMPDPKSALPPLPPPATPAPAATSASGAGASNGTGPKPPLGSGTPTPAGRGGSTPTAKPAPAKPPTKSPRNGPHAH